MGCCFSTGDRRSEREHHGSTSGAPPTSPPPVLEEETVKEVLLETPVVAKVDERMKGMPMGNHKWKVEVGSAAAINGDPNPDRKADEEIVSEISEMCSYSESFSNTTAQEKKDDDEDGVVTQRRPTRKRRGGGRGRGERVVARRTAAPSPERRVQVAPLRPVRGRPMVRQPRNVAEENGRRREAGEGSGMSSRSPVRRGEVGALRNVSDEKSTATRESPDDVVAAEMVGQPRNVAEEDGRRREAGEGSGMSSRSPLRRAEVGAQRNVSDEKCMATREPPDSVVAAEEAESLENPVVSLECFIFL